MNVDGGLTDNNPFDLALHYLQALEPQQPMNAGRFNERWIGWCFPSHPSRRIIVSIRKFDAAASSTIGNAFMSVVNVMLSQSRFLGESLGAITSGDCFDRLVIAPSDQHAKNEALQCGVLSAFGGFFDRGFRAHDFQLGRRNCQRFLQERFLLPQDNPHIKEGMASKTGAILSHAEYAMSPPTKEARPAGEKWIPVIPLCGTAKNEIPKPAAGANVRPEPSRGHALDYQSS